MLTEAKPATYDWVNVDKMIRCWLKERQELIVLYCKVDGLKEFAKQETPLNVRVQALCDVLIDYVSAGHFEIYQALMKEAERFNQEYHTTIDRILPLIQQSTELALDFNDHYSTEEQCEKHMENLARDLNQLGEKMVERFDLEDTLINDLHNCHRDMVA